MTRTSGIVALVFVGACSQTGKPTILAVGPDAVRAVAERVDPMDVPEGFDLPLDVIVKCDEADRAVAAGWPPTLSWRAEIARDACTLPADAITPDIAAATLGDEDLAFVQDGEILTMYQRGFEAEPVACCSIQNVDWKRVGDRNIWVTRLRVKALDQGMIVQLPQDTDGELNPAKMVTWRGRDAPVAPQQKSKLSGTISEIELYSPELEETRRLTIYVPDAPAPPGGYPVIFIADGDVVSRWSLLLEPLIDVNEIGPVMLVGINSGKEAIIENKPDLQGDVREMDYVPIDLDTNAASLRFRRHLAFVADTVVPWVEANYPATTAREMRAVTGFSNGGVFAQHAGVDRPDVFGHAWPMSQGVVPITSAPVETGKERAKFRVSAGALEHSFLLQSRLSAAALEDAGYDVDTHWFVAGHMNDQWNERFVENVLAVFGRRD